MSMAKHLQRQEQNASYIVAANNVVRKLVSKVHAGNV
jgi:hypothetical protein